MSNQTAATRGKEVSSIPIPIQRERGNVLERLNGEVSRRAYQLYERSGNEPGQDLMHWLQAESQILQRLSEIRESGSWYTINTPIRGFKPEEIQVTVDERSALIAATNNSQNPENQTMSTGSASSVNQSVFLLAQWPAQVDPATASAYIKNDTLTLTVKRAGAPSTAA
jgi:HSP20 family molecular chaperone IbpA